MKKPKTIRLTIRDQFAMSALNGMLSSPPIVDRETVNKDKWAGIAYAWADAMLRARKVPPKGGAR
jgi:hypothetical protein